MLRKVIYGRIPSSRTTAKCFVTNLQRVSILPSHNGTSLQSILSNNSLINISRLNHDRQFSTSFTNRNTVKSEGEQKDETPKKTSFLRNVVEFVGEFLGDMTAMLVWKFLFFAVPILCVVWYYFGSSGVTTALSLAWLFILALFTLDTKNEKTK